MKIGKTIVMGLVIIFLIFILCLGVHCLNAAIALWLWGLVMIPIFGAPSLTFWQMFLLIWLVHTFISGSNIVTNIGSSIARSKD